MIALVSALSVTIANGESVSGEVSLERRNLVGLVVPTGWTAAGVGFMVSYDGGTTFVQLNILDHSTVPAGLDEFEILAADVPTGEAIYIALDPTMFLGVTHAKVKSQTAGAAVNQTGAKTLSLVVRDMAA